MKNEKNTMLAKTHLEFYEQHKIAPVSYDLSNIEAHLQRRQSLYTMLGLHPLAFRSSRILEVAAGTGHNSLYLAKELPQELCLLEPNSTAVDLIYKAYDSFTFPHTPPKIISSKLEDFSPIEKFDIVICENWLGCSSHEVSLLKKLSQYVEKNGVLVLTTVSPIGFLPNILRRFLSAYLCQLDESFEKKTDILEKAFGPHLDTLSHMTRNKKDWVQDNMLNPAYFNLCLTIPDVIRELGDHFRIIGSSPSFHEDWRWFKGLYGSNCQWNSQFLSEYWGKAHNFLDYREKITVATKEQNIQLEKYSLDLLRKIEEHEHAYMLGNDRSILASEVLSLLEKLCTLIPPQQKQSIESFQAACFLIRSAIKGNFSLERTRFDGLFGRETIYIALTRQI